MTKPFPRTFRSLHRAAVYIPLVLSLWACGKDELTGKGDYYFLKNDGAVMPVWVRGNVESGIFILTLHGGPGASAHEFVLSRAFRTLEEKYAVVYWDQRFAGIAQGNPAKASLNVDRFVEDTDHCIRLIRELSHPKSLFLLGHSWGGGLGSAYLGRGNHQQGVNGWIDVDGSKNDTLEVQLVKQWVLQQATERLAKGEDPELWNEAFRWYEAHPKPVYSDMMPYIFVSAAAGDVYDFEKFREINKIPYLRLFFKSPVSIAFLIRQTDASFADGIDFTPEMHQIHIPSLVMWGENDGILPVALAQWTYGQLGTPEAHKRLKTFPKCAHGPHFEQPGAFAETVTDFIEAYKTP